MLKAWNIVLVGVVIVMIIIRRMITVAGNVKCFVPARNVPRDLHGFLFNPYSNVMGVGDILILLMRKQRHRTLNVVKLVK